jgi:uncharacterized protein
VNSPADSDSSVAPVPLSPAARRILGVLVEKAKTTPESYPLTLAGIIAGSNQKSNRAPVMEMDETDALNALDELREAGAVREIQGSGRSTKYRHAVYEWMNIESAESAIITELLLRGPQTLGELRTRASRMHAFDDLDAVKETLNKLSEKKLAGAVTPPGRGQMFAHFLYPPNEQQHVVAKAEKLSAAETGPAATRSSVNENQSAIDALLQRLEQVNTRIDDLERRISELES